MKAFCLHIFFDCLFVILIFTGKLHAQHFSTKLYNVNDGLPSTVIYQTFQDRYGYLWIATPAGLSRFDGRQFVNYTLTDGLPSLQVTVIFQDSQLRLWIGTDAGMARFENNRFIRYPANDSLSNFYVFGFRETTNKKIWANTGKGAYEFTDSVWKKLLLYPGYNNIMCRNTIEWNGELYINYPHDIVCKTKAGTWLHIASLQNEDLFNAMSLQNESVWVSTEDNIYKISDHQLIPLYQKGLGIKYFFTYKLDSKNRLWLAGQDFIKVSKPNDWQHFTDVSIKQYGYSFSIKEDSSHNIWVCTEKGLLKIKDIHFSIIDKDNTVPFDGIYNIIALPGERLIFSSGTKTGWLLYYNNRFKKIKPPSRDKNFYRDPIDAYTFDEKNSLWIITRFRKFLHFNDDTIADFSSSLHFKTTEIIYDIAYDKNRRWFFICADSTLLYGSASNLTTFIPHNTGAPIMKPVRVQVTKSGLLLLFVAEKGLFCIDQSNNLVPLIKESGISSSDTDPKSAAVFYEERDFSFWMAVPGFGLFEYYIGKDKLPVLKNHFTVKNGLQSSYILSLTSDKQNRLWVASMTGIDILQKGSTGTWQVFNYAKLDELSLSGSYYQKLVTDVEGNVWLSSPNKTLKFNTSAIHLYKESPKIIIEKILLAFKETNWSKLSDSLYSYYQLPYNPILHYNQNSLGISFNAIDLATSNSSPEYSYKLLPLDTSWSIPSKVKSVSFAQLPAGKYQFMVQAEDMASGWCKPAIFIFTIASPFWEAWWFRFMIIVITTVIIIGIFQARIKKIRHDGFIQHQMKELEMKALKAQMNPHFIYNALNSIQALVANDKKKEGIYYIGSFSRLLRQVLDNSEINIISLDKELETINLYIQLESLRLDMQLQYKKIIPKEIVTEFEKIPPLILQPFVENALWHGLNHKAGEKEITILVQLSDNWLLCNITDNGIGRAKAQAYKNNSLELHQSKGIDITRQRLIDFNEEPTWSPIEFLDLYDIQKQPCGTQVTIRIKRKHV